MDFVDPKDPVEVQNDKLSRIVESLIRRVEQASAPSELAYAQFKLALKRKNNSQNALERIAPTAWILNQWEEGAIYASRLEARPGEESNKLTLFSQNFAYESKAR